MGYEMLAEEDEAIEIVAGPEFCASLLASYQPYQIILY